MSCGGTTRDNANAACISDTVKDINKQLAEMGVDAQFDIDGKLVTPGAETDQRGPAPDPDKPSNSRPPLETRTDGEDFQWLSPEEATALHDKGVSEEAIDVLDEVYSGNLGWDQSRYFEPLRDPTDPVTFEHAFNELISGNVTELVHDRPKTLAAIYNSEHATPAMKKEIAGWVKSMRNPPKPRSAVYADSDAANKAAANRFLELIR